MDSAERQEMLDFISDHPAEDADEKQWVIDQIVRCLCGGKLVDKAYFNSDGDEFGWFEFTVTEGYTNWVSEYSRYLLAWEEGAVPSIF